MRILIVEDEPLIAMDLEDIVTDTVRADCVLAATVEDGLRWVAAGVDFAMLDIDLGRNRETSFPIALGLLQVGIPFCFVSARASQLPAVFSGVPRVAKPYRAMEIAQVLPAAEHAPA